jgi:hypothetical protein
MVALRRVVSVLLALAGAALALLMAQTLVIGHWLRPRPVPDDATVAVFYPSNASWLDFRQAAMLCVDRGLAVPVEKGRDTIVLATPRLHRRVRFRWHGAQGQTETAQELRRLLDGPTPLQAVIGSSNSAMTALLADTLAASRSAHRPALLLTDASASRVTLEGASAPRPLLSIHEGRTFRFILDDARQATLLIGRLVGQGESKRDIAGAFLAVDRNDPYSRDLAEALIEALARESPSTPAPEDDRVLDLTNRAGVASPLERQWARRVWQEVQEAGPGSLVAVFLPLQEGPARRLLLALEGYAPPRTSAGAFPCVIVGDGLGRDALEELAGPLSFPVWCASSLGTGPDAAASRGPLIQAEAIATVLACLDRSEQVPQDLAEALHELDLPATRAIGRPVRFQADGERADDDLGLVLSIEPGETLVRAHRPLADGSWADFVADGDGWRSDAPDAVARRP